MVITERFSSLSREQDSPEAHPGYEDREAQVPVSESETLHFFQGKDDHDDFEVTLYVNPDEAGGAPAINLGFVTTDVIARAIEEGSLVIEGRRYYLLNTRLLRRIL